MTAVAPEQTASIWRRAWLWLEMLALFVGAPLGIYVVVYGWHRPLFVVLLPVFALILIALLMDRRFRVVDMLRKGFHWTELLSIAAIFVVVAPFMLWAAATYLPERYLSFPRDRFELWLLVMALYPLISVSTQELIYRVFYFHRYAPLFNGSRSLAILLNAALFGYAHIIFLNWPSVVLSFFGGLLFAWRYVRTGSYWAVVLEHALYGDLLFTAGLGVYFFTGVSNLR